MEPRRSLLRPPHVVPRDEPDAHLLDASCLSFVFGRIDERGDGSYGEEVGDRVQGRRSFGRD